jgi:hypothetical protein
MALRTSGLRMWGGMRDIIICMTVGFCSMISIICSNRSAIGSPALLLPELLLLLLLLLLQYHPCHAACTQE